MEFGVHLPQIAFSGPSPSPGRLIEYTKTAADLGFRTLCANDHLVYSRPWTDGLTAPASVLPYSGDMSLATTVGIPVQFTRGARHSGQR